MSYTYLYHSGPLSKNVSGLIGCSWDTTGNKKKGFISSLKHSFKLSRGGGEKESKGSSFNILSDNAKRISRELTVLRAANMRKSSTVQTWEDPIDHVTSSTHEEDDERRKKATTRVINYLY